MTNNRSEREHADARQQRELGVKTTTTVTNASTPRSDAQIAEVLQHDRATSPLAGPATSSRDGNRVPRARPRLKYGPNRERSLSVSAGVQPGLRCTRSPRSLPKVLGGLGCESSRRSFRH